MKTLIIGSHGNTGLRLCRILATSQHEPVAMIRSPEQRAAFDRMGVPTVLADLEYPIDHAVQTCQAVVFAAGSGSKTGKDKTVLVDHLGAIRSMVAAQVHGATRYIMLSSTNADVNSNSRIAHYHRAKAYADQHLMESDLDWTVVCPGRLTDKPATDRVNVSVEHSVQGETSREHLAQALALCLDIDTTIRKRFSLLEGEQPLESSLRGLG